MPRNSWKKTPHTFPNLQREHTQTHNLTVFWHSLSVSAELGDPPHPALPCPPLRWWPRLVVISVCGAPDRPSWAKSSMRNLHQAVQNQVSYHQLVPPQCASPSCQQFGDESCHHFLENRRSRTHSLASVWATSDRSSAAQLWTLADECCGYHLRRRSGENEN